MSGAEHERSRTWANMSGAEHERTWAKQNISEHERSRTLAEAGMHMSEVLQMSSSHIWAEASFACEQKQASYVSGSKLHTWAEIQVTVKSLFLKNVQSCVPTNVVFFWQDIELWLTTCWCRAHFPESCVSCNPTMEEITPLTQLDNWPNSYFVLF